MIIYKIQNKINGKIYIGQTIKKLNQRISGHLISNSLIGNALRKYGLQCFDISVIDTADTKEWLNDKEMEYINLYNCKSPNGYNLTDGGENSAGYKHTKESLQKMRKPRKPFTEEHKQKLRKPKTKEHNRKNSEANSGIKNHNYGKHPSEETRQKMRISQKKRSPQSEETKLKRSKTLTGRKPSNEEIRKNSEGHKGKIPWNKGKKNLQVAWNKGLTKEKGKRVFQISKSLKDSRTRRCLSEKIFLLGDVK